jgi:mutator protein MutT
VVYNEVHMNQYDPNYVHKNVFAIVGQKAIIQNAAGQILVLQRSQKAGQGGKWSLAGGAIEDKEDPFQGIEREIREEAQIEVENLKPFSLFSYSSKDEHFVIIIVYTCQAKSENVTLNWEHDDYKWVTPQEALAMDLGEHARIFIEKFSSPALS